MIRLILGMLLVLTPVSGLTPLEAGEMEATVLITNTISFQQDGPRYRVDEATGRLSWYPREYALQEVSAFETEPNGQLSSESLVFNWKSPGRSEDLSVQAHIKTRNSIIPVRSRIPFPIRNVPAGVEQYLGTGEIIDRDAEIEKLAHELASGKNDLYEVVYNLADWTTTNVEYSLASLGAPAIQTASEVLESRMGKCDELTALFISLNRALGIPARFVAGYSYTNSELLQQEWGGHGWAEVWFPEIGWVPFDVTYGEYGYLDAGHVLLKISDDAKETSIDFSARGTDFSLDTEPLSIYVTPRQLVNNYDERITIDLDAPYTEVGFGSAVLILATVTNNKDYYVATRLDLAQTSNTRMLSDDYRNILLRPGETRTLPFLVQIDRGLDRDYRYEFPFKLYTRLGQEDTINIVVHPRARTYTESDFEDIIAKYTSIRQVVPFTVTCDRITAYTGSVAQHTCTVTGVIGDKVRVCSSSCRDEDAASFQVEERYETAGIHTAVYTATALGKTTQFFVTSRTVEPTNLTLLVSAPSVVTTDDEIFVEMSLNSTGAAPRDLEVTLVTRYGNATEQLDSLSSTSHLRFVLLENTLRPGDNLVNITVRYVDELGSQGESFSQVGILLENVGFFDRVLYWMRDAGFWFDRLFS